MQLLCALNPVPKDSNINIKMKVRFAVCTSIIYSFAEYQDLRTHHRPTESEAAFQQDAWVFHVHVPV